MKRMQPKDRRAHQDEHHAHDDAQANDELEPNWPSEHDDLHVVVAPGRERLPAFPVPGGRTITELPTGLEGTFEGSPGWRRTTRFALRRRWLGIYRSGIRQNSGGAVRNSGEFRYARRKPC